MLQLVRFWIEFEKTKEISALGIRIGCGVTAYNYSDAMNIIEEKIFRKSKMPDIIKCIENIDIRDLDQGHVIPNMNSPSFRGIWYPLGYQDYY